MARKILEGLAVSPGIASGPLVLSGAGPLLDRRHIDESEIALETGAVDIASATVISRLKKNLAQTPTDFPEARDLLNTQLELARDAKIIEGAKARIKRGKICASWAIMETINELVQLFGGFSDQYMSERAQDIAAMGECLVHALGGGRALTLSTENAILAAPDFSPAELLELKSWSIKGLAAAKGGATSHVAILARGLKIPAIIGIANLVEECAAAKTAIIDGLRGRLILDPDEDDLKRCGNAAQNYAEFEQAAYRTAHFPARSKDGRLMAVLANLERPAQAKNLGASGAEGVGLYRTEFSFLSGHTLDEDKLVEEYAQIIRGSMPRRAVIRTLDTGADKLLPVQEALHEPNPALGLRGIRFCLRHPGLFRMQLRAILRAGHPTPAAIMLPMVTNLAEVLQTKEIIAEISADLKRANLPHASPAPLGVMVETPAAVLACGALAAECDFLSIGTNDLLHYIMAIDRANRHVAYLHEPLHPAFIRALKTVADSAHQHGIKVSVCGELASDPYGIALLLGLGIDALSAAPRFVPLIKHIVRNLSASECSIAAVKALNENQPGVTRASLRSLLETSLGAELPLHNTFIMPERLR